MPLLEAIQLGLRFDPEVLQLVGPSVGDLPDWTGDAFNLQNAPQGEIRSVWLSSDLADSATFAKYGDVLFNLTFKVLGRLSASKLPMWLDDAILLNNGWQDNGTEWTINAQPSTVADTRKEPKLEAKTTDVKVICHPNPGSGSPTFNINTTRPLRGTIFLFNANGGCLAVRELNLEPGTQEIGMPEAAALPSGVYIWKIIGAGVKAQGHWVKQ